MSSPSIMSMGGNKHWLLVIEDSTNHALSYFLQENSELKDEDVK